MSTTSSTDSTSASSNDQQEDEAGMIAANDESLALVVEEDDDDGDDDEYETVEFDTLTEADFVGSEWKVGMYPVGSRNKEKDVMVTWVRLAKDPNTGKNRAIWGTKPFFGLLPNDEGNWYFDEANQYLTIAVQFPLFTGRTVWCCEIDDYYYFQGVYKGWTLVQDLVPYGQFQAIRLGLDDPDEAGTPPWFSEEYLEQQRLEEERFEREYEEPSKILGIFPNPFAAKPGVAELPDDGTLFGLIDVSNVKEKEEDDNNNNNNNRKATEEAETKVEEQQVEAKDE